MAYNNTFEQVTALLGGARLGSDVRSHSFEEQVGMASVEAQFNRKLQVAVANLAEQQAFSGRKTVSSKEFASTEALRVYGKGEALGNDVSSVPQQFQSGYQPWVPGINTRPFGFDGTHHEEDGYLPQPQPLADKNEGSSSNLLKF
jgi:hypothetical protein